VSKKGREFSDRKYEAWMDELETL